MKMTYCLRVTGPCSLVEVHFSEVLQTTRCNIPEDISSKIISLCFLNLVFNNKQCIQESAH
jgi:hypothetical protein